MYDQQSHPYLDILQGGEFLPQILAYVIMYIMYIHRTIHSNSYYMSSMDSENG